MPLFLASHPLLHRVLLLPCDLLPLNDPRLHHEEDPGHVLEHHAHKGQPERPAEVVVLPVWHEVPPVGQGSKDDERDGAEGARDDEVDAGPSEDADAVVLVDAEKVHHDEDDGDEHANEAEREEELGCNEEGWK